MDENSISNEELEILQEIMNIAFGRATADLAEIINMYIQLSVPSINILKSAELPEYIKEEIKEYNTISLIEQKFWGKFKGIAFLIFPSGAGKELINLLSNEEPDFFGSITLDELEKETLIEVGNILIGACIGKIADLLKDVITFSPPTILLVNHSKDAMPQNLFAPDTSTINLRTVFRFEKKDVSGFLFLIVNQESMYTLKKALDEFMRQYE